MAVKIDIKKKLKSEKSTINEIEPILSEIRKSVVIKDEKFYNIMIAVTEAVNNAISHGNKFDPGKSVFLEISTNDEMLIVVVKDEGEGFDPNEIKNCLDPENLLKDNGRGVFIINELMDSIKYDTSHGTTLTMKYKLD